MPNSVKQIPHRNLSRTTNKAHRCKFSTFVPSYQISEKTDRKRSNRELQQGGTQAFILVDDELVFN